MHKPIFSWVVVGCGAIVSSNVYAQDNPPAVPTVSSDAPLLEAPPPPATNTPDASALVAAPPSPTAPTMPAAPSLTIPPSPGPAIWGPATEIRPPWHRKWYGWKTLIAVVPTDIVFLALMAHDRTASSTGVARVVSMATNVLAGPINHWSQGRVGRAYVALAANLLAPVLGWTVDHDAGPIAGLMLVPVIDAAFSVQPERIIVSTTHARSRAPSSFAIVPMLDANHKGLSLMGQF